MFVEILAEVDPFEVLEKVGNIVKESDVVQIPDITRRPLRIFIEGLDNIKVQQLRNSGVPVRVYDPEILNSLAAPK